MAGLFEATDGFVEMAEGFAVVVGKMLKWPKVFDVF